MKTIPSRLKTALASIVILTILLLSFSGCSCCKMRQEACKKVMEFRKTEILEISSWYYMQLRADIETQIKKLNEQESEVISVAIAPRPADNLEGGRAEWHALIFYRQKPTQK